jgi:hypothetical protein
MMNLEGHHPAVAEIVQYFEYSHLPAKLQPISAEVYKLAQDMLLMIPSGPELTVGLRKLLEAKDCFVRAALNKAA